MLTIPWPLPALLAWAAAWAVFAGLRWLAVPNALALGLALSFAATVAVYGTTPWRRVFVAAGFPVSLAASGLAGGLPAWAWLLPLLLLALLYPMKSWRDAPLFPTPQGALQGLEQHVALSATARIVDAGCGLGAGLRELHRVYPQAQLFGLEWSWPLRLACALRCRFARVQRADIWAADWSGYDMVYLFQRPESMPQAVDKAGAELRRGAWLVSLEFAAPGLVPQAVLPIGGGRNVWAYQLPLRRR